MKETLVASLREERFPLAAAQVRREVVKWLGRVPHQVELEVSGTDQVAERLEVTPDQVERGLHQVELGELVALVALPVALGRVEYSIGRRRLRVGSSLTNFDRALPFTQ